MPADPMPIILPAGARVSITSKDVVKGLQQLSHGKAIGVDQLSDNVLRNAVISSPELAAKLAAVFERWINGEDTIPQYLKVARTVLLSKTDSQFPPPEQSRVIAIACALSKFYEVFVLRELKRNIEATDALHSHQRGFVSGKS